MPINYGQSWANPGQQRQGGVAANPMQPPLPPPGAQQYGGMGGQMPPQPWEQMYAGMPSMGFGGYGQSWANPGQQQQQIGGMAGGMQPQPWEQMYGGGYGQSWANPGQQPWEQRFGQMAGMQPWGGIGGMAGGGMQGNGTGWTPVGSSWGSP